MKSSCKEASLLLTKSVDDSLTGPERLKLEVHLRICKTCCRLQEQLRFLRKAAGLLPEDAVAPDPECSEALRASIKRKIRTADSDSEET